MGATKQITQEEIIEVATPLFSESGFQGVTMRQIAEVLGIKAASLYYHFPDKQTLYVATLQKTFSNWSGPLLHALKSSNQPGEQLRKLVGCLCELMTEDKIFSTLIHREILDGDKNKLKLLSENVFGDLFAEINLLCRHLSPDHDPHLMTISIFALVSYHFQLTPIRQFLPGFKKTHNDADIIAKHVISVLENSFE